MKKAINKDKIVINKFVFIGGFFLLLLFMVRLSYLCLSPIINGINIKEFVASRNTQKQVLIPKRGSIYDSKGNILAQNVTSYTLIAYLSEKRTDDPKKPRHVVDKQKTAELLAPILKAEVNTIYNYLNKEGQYQVEFGKYGKGLTELQKDEIIALKLPGLGFSSEYKRYYPLGDFASYLVGYAKTDDKGNIVGEMGIEAMYNDILAGTPGYLEYQKDGYGYKLPDTKEIRVDPIDGQDIYLTIDSSIQMFLENRVKEIYAAYNPEWILSVAAKAKTGEIIGSVYNPSFDPNLKNMTTYMDPLVANIYEPGSTMKIFTYMCAIEKGSYNGNDTYLSGTIKIGPDTIKDWNTTGWGTLNYNTGFTLSSNVGVVNMINKFISKNDLKHCFERLGFGNKTGFQLPKEVKGNIKFTYPIEVASAGFGQGITTTPIQNIQALTSIANDGQLLKPYLISKVVNNQNKIIENGKKEVVSNAWQKKTINTIKELMYNVIYNDPSLTTGSIYRIDGYDLIGKTGTAQIFDNKKGQYAEGTTEAIVSFAGMFPKDDPEIIVYNVIKRASYGRTTALSTLTKNIIMDIANYYNIYKKVAEKNTTNTYEVKSYINKYTEDTINKLSGNIKYLIIGNGNKIINQYPSSGTNMSVNDKLILFTNDSEIVLPNLVNYSLKEVKNICNFMKINCNIEGSGYVVSQSKEGKILDNEVINFSLNSKISN